MSNVLIVHAHHEPQSFCSSMARTAADTLIASGHEVVFTDLHAMGFDPVSDRRNFTTTANADYLKQQQEEAHASEHGGFSPLLEAEIQKLEKCDVLIFSFPLWWFGMPAILKGWVDRVFAYKRIYSRGRWHENGVGAGKRAMVLMTTGGSASKYGAGGLHAPMDTVLAPIHQGIFWFNGYSPLPPFIAWSAAHGTDADRHGMLETLRGRIKNILAEPVIEYPHAAEFDAETGIDTMPRFMVTARRSRTPDEDYARELPAEIACLQTLRRQGQLLSLQVAPAQINGGEWRCFLQFRASSGEEVRSLCEALPLSSYLSFEITPLAAAHAM